MLLGAGTLGERSAFTIVRVVFLLVPPGTDYNGNKRKPPAPNLTCNVADAEVSKSKPAFCKSIAGCSATLGVKPQPHIVLPL